MGRWTSAAGVAQRGRGGPRRTPPGRRRRRQGRPLRLRRRRPRGWTGTECRNVGVPGWAAVVARPRVGRRSGLGWPRQVDGLQLLVGGESFWSELAAQP